MALITPLIPELYCTNITNSLDFYTQTLGFNVLYQREENKFAMLERQEARIMLEEIPRKETTRKWLAAPLEPPFGRGINLQIKTDKIDELYDRVQKSTARVFLPIEEKWYRANDIELGQHQFIILDPDGYMLRFFQSIGKKTPI